MDQRFFVLGDCHGAYRALLQVLERSNFNYSKDFLICLGDICDGWPESSEALSELLKIKNLIYILGNHDNWFLNWATGNNPPNFSSREEHHMWLYHGGRSTYESYLNNKDTINKHIDFLMHESKLYHIDDNNRLFLHGGFNPSIPIENQGKEILIWDRNFWKGMYNGRDYGKDYNEIYIGHTPTINFKSDKEDNTLPINRRNVWNLDTGAAYTGKLSLMDINTKKIFQSDLIYKDLYPYHKGRNDMPYRIKR